MSDKYAHKRAPVDRRCETIRTVAGVNGRVPKRRFETYDDAKAARDRENAKGDALVVYRCDACGFYHLGHR